MAPVTASLSLVLASASPRRRDVLAEAGFRFVVVPPQVDESPQPGESPDYLVSRLAGAKARQVARRFSEACILGVDTIVVLEGDILGKPEDERRAAEMLLRLSGREHLVYSGFSIVAPMHEVSGVEVTSVSMRGLSREQALAYAATGEPLDKAGAYAIQGEGVRFISRVNGSVRNVAGLPIEAIRPLLAAVGVYPEKSPMHRPVGIMSAEQRSEHG